MKHAAYLLAGPTASGKSAAATILARRLGAVILNADSMVVYRGMDIGTAKPSPTEQLEFKMGCINLVEPSQEFSAGAWLAAAHAYLRTLSPSQLLIVVGGTGLYFTALLRGLDRPRLDEKLLADAEQFIHEQGTAAAFTLLQQLDPITAANLADAQNPRRLAAAITRVRMDIPANSRTDSLPSYPVLHWERGALRNRIRSRLQQMMEQGWPQEVTALHRSGITFSRTAAGAIGYSLPQDIEDIFIRTCRLAKRQDTWFRHQAEPLYIEVTTNDTAQSVADKVQRIWDAHGPWELEYECSGN